MANKDIGEISLWIFVIIMGCIQLYDCLDRAGKIKHKKNADKTDTLNEDS